MLTILKLLDGTDITVAPKPDTQNDELRTTQCTCPQRKKSAGNGRTCVTMSSQTAVDNLAYSGM